MPEYRPLVERLVEKLDTTGDCWKFTGAIAPNGYGRIGDGPHRVVQAHRAAYEAFVGPIPEGLHIDHLCRNRACCKPSHLEAVTQRENNTRANHFRFSRATACKKGHEYVDGSWTVYEPPAPRKPVRSCLVCRRAASAKQQIKRNAQRGAA